jgi:hypothetical protein
MNDPAWHPDGMRLDALAIGEVDDEARAHVAECSACGAYVTAVAEGARTFTREDACRAGEFIEAVRQHERAEALRNRGRARTRWAAAAPALALAAGVALFVHLRGSRTPEGAVAAIDNPAEVPMRFKGGMQAVVIVDHLGVQSRNAGALSLEPEDRIRLEIGLDHDARVVAGVLADDGQWAVLQPATLLAAGTHYSEESIRFDREVPSGWILMGSEDAVGRARRTRDFHEVAAIRLIPKGP